MTGTQFSFFTIVHTGSNNVCRFSASLIVDLRSFRLQPPRRLGIRLYTLRFINVNSQQTWTSRAFNDTYQGVPAIFFIFLINQLLVNNVYHFVLFSSLGRNVRDLFIKMLVTAARNGDGWHVVTRDVFPIDDGIIELCRWAIQWSLNVK